VPVPVGCLEKDAFQYDVENVKKVVNDKTRAIFVNSPSNPTGHLTTPETMQKLSGIGPWIISDEIYHGLVYDKKERSILEYTDKAFVLNGFSKLYAMTGLRIGYMIVPKEFIRPIQKIQQSLFICPNSVSQQAAIKALDCRVDTEKMKSEYHKRRDLMVRMLRDIGFGISDEPDGAFYIFANARKFSDDSYKLAFDILEHAGVGVTPGIDFGKQGEGYLRFSYANSLENIEKGLESVGKYLQNYSHH
jgi:aspartate/methionine/tyrosine aminotransferase